MTFNKKYKYILLQICVLSCLFCRFPDIDFNTAHIEVVETKKTKFSQVSFVKINKKIYLIKQIMLERRILGVVRDAVTAHIAETLNIAHKVDIIPADTKFPGKINQKWPATIHTIAPGKMLKEQNSIYRRMNLKQDHEGIRREMFSWMAQHPDIAKIVALDTFICNNDRHKGNLFYEKKKNSFCAIDMDTSFKYNLSALACNILQKFLDDSSLVFTKQERYGLLLYKKYLQLLIDKHPSKTTLISLNTFAKKAGFFDGSPLFTKKIKSQLEKNKKIIVESYEDAKKLIVLLDKLIKKRTY